MGKYVVTSERGFLTWANTWSSEYPAAEVLDSPSRASCRAERITNRDRIETQVLKDAGLDSERITACFYPASEVETAVTYTTAGVAYDWFKTEDLGEVGRTTGAIVKVIRKVRSPILRVEAQRDRYRSGCHMAVDQADWDKLVDNKLVSTEGFE